MLHKVITCLLLMIGWSVMSQAVAASAWPVPLYMPDIEYPESLRRTSRSERISLRVLIRADGSVQFIEVADGTDPEFIAITRKAVEQWRFRPWTPPASSPQGEVLRITYDYLNAGADRQPLAGNLKLAQVLCHQLNEELRSESRWWMPRQAGVPGVFQQTENYLSHDPVIRTYVPGEQRQALVMVLLEARTEVIARCKANPAGRYVDQLPDKLREIL